MLESLRLKGFRRYADERLSFEPGVCFIDGENNAGKTTLFLAIEYALFGTAGAIRSPMALLQPGAGGLGVELVFTGRGGKRYRLQRIHVKPPKARTKLVGHFTLKELVARGPGETPEERYLLSSDFQDHEDALALKLSEITGISRRVFDLAVHVRQGEVAAILDGSPGLDIALGITAAVASGEELRALSLLDEEAAAALPAIKASLEHAEKERALLSEDDEAAKKAVARLEAKAAAAQQVLAAGKGGGADGAEDPLEALIERLEEAQSAVEEVEGELDSAAAEAAGVERGDLLGRIQRREAQLARAEKGAVTCEHCGGPIDHALGAAELAEWKQRLEALDAGDGDGENEDEEADVGAATSPELKQKLAKAEAALAQVRAEARKVQGAKDVGDDELAERLDELRDERRMAAVQKTATAQAELEAATSALEEARAALSRKAERLAESERERARLSAEVEALGARARRAEKLRALAAAFKQYQESLREHAAADLAEATLRIHRQLAGAEEISALSIDPARYQVLVTPTDVGAQVPASTAQGGGHKLLLGLAFRLALVERLGPFPFALLDEPTYGLDEKRRTALLERISSLRLAEQILLITHQPMGEVKGQRVVIERAGKQSAQRRAAP
ncbi:MAG: AAA family ATPase [Myxococcales bacterium]